MEPWIVCIQLCPLSYEHMEQLQEAEISSQEGTAQQPAMAGRPYLGATEENWKVK